MRRRDLSRRVTEHAHFGSVKWCMGLLARVGHLVGDGAPGGVRRFRPR